MKCARCGDTHVVVQIQVIPIGGIAMKAIVKRVLAANEVPEKVDLCADCGIAVGQLVKTLKPGEPTP